MMTKDESDIAMGIVYAKSVDREARLREAIEDAAKIMQFTDSWICELMDNEEICGILREMKEWDALCAFQDGIREQKTKLRAALEDQPDARKAGEEMVAELQRKYNELIFAVGNKHPGETRHETALRYIQQAEEPSGEGQGRYATGV
jgi:hypothetical protein